MKRLSIISTCILFTFAILAVPNVIFGAPNSKYDSGELQIHVRYYKDTAIVKSSTGFDVEKNMPWIGAIVIGVLTVLTNIFISNKVRNTNFVLAENQISVTKTIALEQIEQSRKNNERDFNKTVVSASRQLWINNTRDIIATMLAIIDKFLMHQSISNSDASELELLICKAELMLIPTEYSELLDVMKELRDCCKQVQMGNKEYNCIEGILVRLKIQAGSTLKTEWDKMKQGI